MDQVTFSDLEYENKKRKTRREKFLERMDALVPWQKLENLPRALHNAISDIDPNRKFCGAPTRQFL